MRPLQEFLQTETAGGILLLAAAVAALVWVNSPYGDSYRDFWDTYVTIDLDILDLKLTLGHWVNDGLMALFFFVVGLEIKREVLKGELADRRRAALPVAAALGGMVVPALVYLAFNLGGDGARGWGIPMATDIAFAIGVLSLLGNRVPVSLKVFLLALAIADDLGAIIIIALFYTENLKPEWLGLAVLMLALTWGLGRAGVRDLTVYLAIGIVTWFAVHESGVHATIAGVALGLLTPVNPYYEGEAVEDTAQALINDVRAGRAAGDADGAELAKSALGDLEELARESQSVLDRLEHALHPWTSFVIIPVFALANAGVDLGGGVVGEAVSSPITLGAALGLMIGKPVGITLFAFAAARLGLATLPEGIRWVQVAGVAMIAGIGFTVSIFIANLAFTDAELIDEAKIGILAGSVAICVLGLAVLRLTSREQAPR